LVFGAAVLPDGGDGGAGSAGTSSRPDGAGDALGAGGRAGVAVRARRLMGTSDGASHAGKPDVVRHECFVIERVHRPATVDFVRVVDVIDHAGGDRAVGVPVGLSWDVCAARSGSIGGPGSRRRVPGERRPTDGFGEIRRLVGCRARLRSRRVGRLDEVLERRKVEPVDLATRRFLLVAGRNAAGRRSVRGRIMRRQRPCRRRPQCALTVWRRTGPGQCALRWRCCAGTVGCGPLKTATAARGTMVTSVASTSSGSSRGATGLGASGSGPAHAPRVRLRPCPCTRVRRCPLRPGPARDPRREPAAPPTRESAAVASRQLLRMRTRVATRRGSRRSALGSRDRRQSVRAVRTTLRAGRSGSTCLNIYDVVTIDSAISHAGIDVDVECEKVVDQHEKRHEQGKHAVLRVRELDRQRVAGRTEVDESRSVDVVVCA